MSPAAVMERVIAQAVAGGGRAARVGAIDVVIRRRPVGRPYAVWTCRRCRIDGAWIGVPSAFAEDAAPILASFARRHLRCAIGKTRARILGDLLGATHDA